MDPGQFFASSNVLIVAGKGGVGKTVTAATCAVSAARCGLSVLLVEVGGRSATAALFDADGIGYEAREVHRAGDLCAGSGPVSVRSITPDDALVEWLSLHGFRRLVDRMARSGLLEIVATATPGIKDLLVLGKIRNIEETGAFDLVVVDAPAAGHALGFLRAPATIGDTASAGTIHRQAVEALALLTDPTRSRVLLVTLPEETPVNELVQTAFAIEEEIGVTLTPVLINAVLPLLDWLDDRVGRRAVDAGLDPEIVADLEFVARFRQARTDLQQAQIARLTEALPLERLVLPQIMEASIDSAGLGELADALLDGIESLPEAVS